MIHRSIIHRSLSWDGINFHGPCYRRSTLLRFTMAGLRFINSVHAARSLEQESAASLIFLFRFFHDVERSCFHFPGLSRTDRMRKLWRAQVFEIRKLLTLFLPIFIRPVTRYLVVDPWKILVFACNENSSSSLSYYRLLRLIRNELLILFFCRPTKYCSQHC